MKISWSGYNWITQERWGMVHPDKYHWWYDSEAVEIDANNNLILKTRYNPKYFPEIKKTSTTGVGLISSTDEFGFGEFTVEAKLPSGPFLWPAFWMWSWDSWPPEIDVFEAYSNSQGKYFDFTWTNPFNFWKVESNLHYGYQQTKSSIGARKNLFSLVSPDKRFNKYSVIWTKYFVKWLYNDRIVRVCRDSKIMSELSNKKMNVIINNGVTNEGAMGVIPESSFIIKSFNYKPL
jgi:beta-glucanase (GH16 family)